jgi:predicted lipoprotein with Yx(FWY)xxD motif
MNESCPHFVVQDSGRIPRNKLALLRMPPQNERSHIVKTRLMITLAGAALAVVALAGCSSPAATTSNTSAADTSSSSSSAGGYGDVTTPSTSAADSGATTGSGDAAVASTSLGQIVVDGKGMTAYYYDPDVANSGTSTCTGQCAALWPAIESSSTTPTVDGVTGTVATIKGTDGGNQLTINGRPIYTFANDKAAGDVNGQGLMGIWWVVSPAGDEIKTAK